MSPTQHYLQGRVRQALAGWAAQLADGRPWSLVEAEILTVCDGQVDVLRELLVQAETLREDERRRGRRRPTLQPDGGRGCALAQSGRAGTTVVHGRSRIVRACRWLGR